MEQHRIHPLGGAVVGDGIWAFADDIFAIDANYVRPGLAAFHLLVSDGKAAFFDTGTQYSLPSALRALELAGLTPDDVAFVIPSHVHLDHAGGAGAMMSAFPNAQLYVHSRGAAHMIDPAKLWRATVEVYGERRAASLYGCLKGIDPNRVSVATEGMRLALGCRELLILDTPGHARHHICLYDGVSRSIFTGDMFGLSYRELDVNGRPSVIPTTTPTQFDPEAMRVSIQRLMSLAPQQAFLTHFSRIGDVQTLGNDLLRQLEMIVQCAEQSMAIAPSDRLVWLEEQMRLSIAQEGSRQGWPLSGDRLMALLSGDLTLNAQGIAHWTSIQAS